MVYAIAYEGGITDIEEIKAEAEIRIETMDRELTDKTVEDIETDELKITQITNGLDLYLEGNEMSHCVGGYSKMVERDETIILKVRGKERKNNATVDLRFTKNNAKEQYYIVQMMHKHNVAVTGELKIEIERLIDETLMSSGLIMSEVNYEIKRQKLIKKEEEERQKIMENCVTEDELNEVPF